MIKETFFRKIHNRRGVLARCSACFMALLLMFSLSAEAASLEDLERQKNEAQQQREGLESEKNKAQDVVNDLRNEADALGREYSSLNSQLQKVSNEITGTERAIAAASRDIRTLERELEEVEAAQKGQYESMKVRMRYMYENDSTSMLVEILESGSIAEFIKKAEYASAIVSYDRQMVDAYAELQKTLTAKRQELAGKQASLSGYQASLSDKQSRLDDLVENAGNHLSAKNSEVSAAQLSVDEFNAKITQMREQERTIEAQYAAAQEALAQQIAQEEQASGVVEDTSGALEGYTEADLKLMAAIIQAEADNQPYAGKIAVGSVVMNRVKSSKFPNTISGVVYQANQFAPVKDGHLALILERGPNETCYRAAREVLNGARNVEYLFFWTVSLANQRNIWGRTRGQVIGDHYFYNWIA